MQSSFPIFLLKEEYKNRIKKDRILQGIIAESFDIHPTTLLRWIEADAPQLLNFTLLNIVWSYTNSSKKITELLTIRKQ